MLLLLKQVSVSVLAVGVDDVLLRLCVRVRPAGGHESLVCLARGDVVVLEAVPRLRILRLVVLLLVVTQHAALYVVRLVNLKPPLVPFTN